MATDKTASECSDILAGQPEDANEDAEFEKLASEEREVEDAAMQEAIDLSLTGRVQILYSLPDD